MKKIIKPIVCLVILLFVIALTTGCIGYVSKATGGGWFIDEETQHKCTFGFNVNLKDNPGAVQNDKTFTGQFQFKDHGTGTKIHLDEITYIEPDDSMTVNNIAYFEGWDKGGNFVVVAVLDLGEPGPDAGDCIAIWYNPDPDTFDPDIDPPDWYGTLGGGNIQAH